MDVCVTSNRICLRKTLINIYILFSSKYSDTLGAKCRILLVMNGFLIDDFYEILLEIPQKIYIIIFWITSDTKILNMP